MEGWERLRGCEQGRARETVRLPDSAGWGGRPPNSKHPQAGMNRDGEKKSKLRKPHAYALQSKCF